MQTAEPLHFTGTQRFQVLSQLGQGGGGLVYEVLDRERNTRLALKTLRTLDAGSILFLKSEFRAVQDVHHPNLVTLNELFEEGGRWFFTMEYVQGAHFFAYVRGVADRNAAPVPLIGGGVDERKLRAALGQLAQGLCALHGGHKVHRDIKPSNILVTPEGRVVIVDFGIVSELGRRHEDDAGVVGTAHYMAPEQAASEAVGPAADWYAVGTILYQALTGRLPFTGTKQQILERKRAAEPRPPDAMMPGLPPDLSALCVDLLRLDPARRPSGTEVLARLGVRSDDAGWSAGRRAAFVGRRAELRTIEKAFAQTTDGRAATVFVEGESGVGKSSLVGEFAARAKRTADALVLRGRCYERESVPFKAVDGVVDDLCRYLTALPDDEADALLPDDAALLRRLFPVLQRVPGIAEARITLLELESPQETRMRVFAVFRALLCNVAARKRLVLVIEDLQWADADSLALLAEVLRPPDPPAMLVLPTLRLGTETQRRSRAVLTAIARMPGEMRHVRLDALPVADARELIVQLLNGDDRNPANTVEAILAESQGHPLFIVELARHRWVNAERGVPARLDDALWERAARLAPAARGLLELVAVAGVPLPYDTVAQAAALDPGQLFALVATLRADHLVRTTGVADNDTVEPYHDRVRESVLGHLSAENRRRWHMRLAVALETTEGADPELLVAHWQGAGDPARAAEYAVRAAGKAAATLAFDHAAALYRLALALDPPAGAAAKALKIKLAEALTNAGSSAGAARVYLDAAGADTSNQAIDLRRRAAEELVCSGHVDEGTATRDGVLHAVGIRTFRSSAAVIASLLWFSLVLAVRGLKFTPRAAAQIDPRVLLRLDCLHSAGCGYGMTDHVRGREFQIRTLLYALRIGEPFRVARALAFYAMGLATGGRATFARAMQLQANVAAMAAEQRLPYLKALAGTVAAYAYQFTSQWREAREAFVYSEELFRDRCVGVTYELNAIRTLLCRTLVQRGEIADLARRSGSMLREAERRGDRYAAVNMRSTPLPFLALVRDDPDEGQRELDLAARDLSPHGFFVQHMFCVLGQAHVSLYRGDAAATVARIARLWPTMQRSMLLRVQALRVQLADVRARAYIALAAQGGPERARALRDAERQVRLIERERGTWRETQAHLLRAGLAHVRGQRDEALAHVVAAEAGFDAAEMALQAAIARRRRGILLGGEEGQALRAKAEAWMRTRGIASPARMSALFSPGFPLDE